MRASMRETDLRLVEFSANFFGDENLKRGAAIARIAHETGVATDVVEALEGESVEEIRDAAIAVANGAAGSGDGGRVHPSPIWGRG